MQTYRNYANILSGPSCCFIRKNPDVLSQESINPLEKRRLVDVALEASFNNKHKQCVEQVLKGNKYLMKVSEGFILEQLIAQASTWDEATDALDICLKCGLNVILAIKYIYVSLSHDRRLKDLYHVCLKHARGYLIPVSIRGAANQIANVLEQRLYSIYALQGAILSCYMEFLHVLRLTGTSSENMMEAITLAHSNAQIGKTQALKMKEEACKALTLKDLNRICIWKTLSKKEDVYQLPIPKAMKEFLLFDETEFSIV